MTERLIDSEKQKLIMDLKVELKLFKEFIDSVDLVKTRMVEFTTEANRLQRMSRKMNKLSASIVFERHNKVVEPPKRNVPVAVVKSNIVRDCSIFAKLLGGKSISQVGIIFDLTNTRIGQIFKMMVRKIYGPYKMPSRDRVAAIFDKEKYPHAWKDDCFQISKITMSQWRERAFDVEGLFFDFLEMNNIDKKDVFNNQRPLSRGG